ncbi:MAG: argininosuccinate lyase, partial [Clostridia bacterium]|nr:argininosuccinate lyase [Clostridia bacterium]
DLSVMPQKKNPDVAELVRGKTGRAYGNLVALLTVMKGLPLAYNKDMQEDKESLFDSVDTVVNCLVTFTKMLSTVTVLKDNAKVSAEKGYINATDVADYLTKKGVPFRDAYKCSGQLVALCITKDVSLNALPFEYYKQANELFEEDIYQAIDLLTCLNKRTSYDAPSPKMVKGQIEELKKTLASI